MLAIDAAEVRRIAELARIDLEDEDIEIFRHQLQEILDYFAILDGVDTAAIPPTLHAPCEEQVARADIERPSLPPADALRNAPEARAGLFRVPRVLKPR
jgi:aspartyl-tRNA(Asn)/glutamyl-tRNA(Gln) amidotransferase subunit C